MRSLLGTSWESLITLTSQMTSREKMCWSNTFTHIEVQSQNKETASVDTNIHKVWLLKEEIKWHCTVILFSIYVTNSCNFATSDMFLAYLKKSIFKMLCFLKSLKIFPNKVFQQTAVATDMEVLSAVWCVVMMTHFKLRCRLHQWMLKVVKTTEPHHSQRAEVHKGDTLPGCSCAWKPRTGLMTRQH